ncbi:hypothetical protein CRE_21361 [Caenorhabditis remanei]|uniref:BTB domain-containing protein n=1 Tax=Caenorhabditis remanei TaxID=31234 RepID=E3MUX5_CAERE|nr:hypothetical protein CRE_21361 [Caenorhabditis remanei]
MSDTTDDANNPNNRMLKFQKLQSETNEIQSIFSKNEQNEFNEELLKTMKELTYQSQQKINEELLKTNNDLKDQNTELKNQSEQVLKEIRSMKSDLEESKKQHSSEMHSMKSTMSNSADSVLLPDTPVNNGIRAIVVGKEFVLKHVFENVSEIGASPAYSEEEEHFNIPWKMYVYRDKGCIAFYLKCPKSLKVDEWSALTNIEYSIVSNQGTRKTRECSKNFGNKKYTTRSCSYGWPDFIDWKDLEKDFIVDGKLRVEIRVKITKTTGLYGKPLRNFDERNKAFSDVVIVVKEKKFHVFKLHLAAQSAYFKSLLSEISPNAEVEVSDIESEDFQVFLEVLYGEPAINEKTVEVILYLAEKYDTHAVTKKCEEFLIDGSGKEKKKKLQLAIKYKLDKLKKHCFDNIVSAGEIRSVLPSDISDLHPSTMKTLLQKSLDLLE